MKAAWFVALHLAVAGFALVERPAPYPTPKTEPISLSEAAMWTSRMTGRAFRPVPPTEDDIRFSTGLPGVTARFTDGHADFILRRVLRPTRALHAAATCFRASGYRVTPQPIHLDTGGAPWGRFLAGKPGEQLEVMERIADPAGRGWYDVSSWYWAASLNRVSGPWHAVTVIRRFP